ncbi:MAG: hypothetical protein PHO02_05380 [Candidatus Nanoarchaeia archaeon]|nr:hypothetical protein [Candidatus Nanoarchaeia archaeon]
MEISQLEKALLDSWDADTSSDSASWTKENPAWGQCAVTSLIVNDYLGGKLVWANAVLPGGKSISHYFNNIDGKEIDLTRRQFPDGTLIPEGIDKFKTFPSTRDYVLSFEATRTRYEKLKEKVKNALY